jgi:16S rRNA (uracil1498-N3)-methyltransferase
MHRFYSPAKEIASHTITLSDPGQLHHIKNVLRLKAGSELIIFDGRKNEYLAGIEKIQPQKIVLKIKSNLKSCVRNCLKISVACAIPKKGGMDHIVDKLTQLGVDRIIPLETERVMVKIAGQKIDARIGRWRRIALSASQQSRRRVLPVIESVKGLDELLADAAAYDLKLIFTLQGERRSLKEVIVRARANNVLLLIGPEGDFTPREADSAREKGFVPVSLGDSVLRVDTACIAAVSMLNYALRTN